MGISTEQRVYRNLTPSQLYEHAVRRREGIVTSSGPFAAVTSPHTGRSPNDKFLVQEPDSTSHIWWGKVNQSISPALIVYTMFLLPADAELSSFAPGITVLHAPELHADPEIHGTKSGPVIVVSF